jgi:hypothetical protein
LCIKPISHHFLAYSVSRIIIMGKYIFLSDTDQI